MFYNIKEVEAQGSKYVGVHAMQIKDLLQALVDDGLVNAEKCGVTTLYWCFEYDKQKKMDIIINAKKQKLIDLQMKRDRLIKSLELASKDRKRGDSEAMFDQIQSLTKKRDQFKQTLESNVFDLDRVCEIKSELSIKVNNAQICTDNIETLVYHFNKNNGITREFFQQELSIPEEFKELPDITKVFSDLK